MVSPGIYRSGFPTRYNKTFLQRLGLRTIVNLADEPTAIEDWIETQQLRAVTCAVIASREPFAVPDPEEMLKALRVLVDPSCHPVLIHSLRGDSAVSIVIGILRRLQRWSLSSIFDEYRRFASSGAATLLDLQVIELFDVSALQSEAELGTTACRVSPPGKELHTT